jgi:hypothetical protein
LAGWQARELCARRFAPCGLPAGWGDPGQRLVDRLSTMADR